MRPLPLALALLLLSASGCRDADPYAHEMGHQHAGDVPVPALAGGAGVDGDLVTARVVYARGEHGDVTGFLARPITAGAALGDVPANKPAVIVIHEWWGLNDNVREMTRRLAEQGYTALAVDLYRGEIAEAPDRAQRLLGEAMGRQPEIEDNLRQARRYLAEQEGAGPVGVIGWCFGGMWSLRAALMLGEDVDAAVVFYGNPVLARAQLARLQAPVLGIFGAEDTSIPVSDVRQFERTLQDLGKDVTVEVYEGAGHAFANPSGQRYVPEAAEDAWRRTMAFLAEHLRGE